MARCRERFKGDESEKKGANNRELACCKGNQGSYRTEE
jgi:hypothetical protein